MEDYREVKFDRMKYNSDYTKEHYERITVLVPNGTKSSIQKRAADAGMSMTQYMLTALEYYENRKDDE